MSAVPSSAPNTDNDADVAERLFGEFEASHGLAAISRIVQRCRTDHAAPVPAGTTRETLEALCRRRLEDPSGQESEPFALPGS